MLGTSSKYGRAIRRLERIREGTPMTDSEFESVRNHIENHIGLTPVRAVRDHVNASDKGILCVTYRGGKWWHYREGNIWW